MKKSFRIALAALVCLSPMGMQAQSVDFSQYEETQIINSDFEDWSGKDFKNVPVGWHSFESVGGIMPLQLIPLNIQVRIRKVYMMVPSESLV